MEEVTTVKPDEFPGLLLATGQIQSGTHVRDLTHACYGRLINAHLLLLNVFAAPLIKAQNGNHLFHNDPHYSQRLALSAVFVQGLRVVEFAIEEGRLLQAQTLLRQEVELLAQMRVLSNGKPDREGYAPNLKFLEESLRRTYNDLSGSAHLTVPYKTHAATLMDDGDLPVPIDETEGTRFYPTFDADAARQCFGLHLLLMAQVAAEMLNDMSRHSVGTTPLFGDMELAWLDGAIEILAEEGIVRKPKA